MTTTPPLTENARGAHFEIEAFSEYAFRELRDQPLHPPGICAYPYCSRPFVPARDWQAYCCGSCRDRDRRDLRAFGEKIAPAQLAYRLGKYETVDPARRALSQAGRRYSGLAATALVQHRRMMAKKAGGSI